MIFNWVISGFWKNNFQVSCNDIVTTSELYEKLENGYYIDIVNRVLISAPLKRVHVNEAGLCTKPSELTPFFLNSLKKMSVHPAKDSISFLANVDITLEPKGIPRQLLYASSASDTSSEYYKKFRYFSERMLIGDQKYFVCNFNIDMVMKAKYNGEIHHPRSGSSKYSATPITLLSFNLAESHASPNNLLPVSLSRRGGVNLVYCMISRLVRICPS